VPPAGGRGAGWGAGHQPLPDLGPPPPRDRRTTPSSTSTTSP